MVNLCSKHTEANTRGLSDALSTLILQFQILLSIQLGA